MPTSQPTPALIGGEQLAAWAGHRDSAAPFSPLQGQACLLVNADDVPAPQQRPGIATWLRSLPVPSIAVGTTLSEFSAACDTQVDTLDAAQPLIANIRQAPRAAAVLAQLLRLNTALSLADALVAESLAYATLQGGAEFQAWLAAHRAATPAVATDDGPAVLLAREDDRLQLTLNRASNHNAMSVEMRDALCEALQLVVTDDSITRVALNARGKCFSTGGDLTEFGSAPDTATAHLVRSLALPGRVLARCADRVTVSLHGACIGSGIEFPAFAGHIEAHAGTWFQLPELKYGLIPGAGGCVSVARRIGRQRTAWMVLSGARVTTVTALQWGLVDAVIEPQ